MPGRGSYAVIEDRYLVAASLAGSPEAYDELVRRYRRAVILLARKALNSHEAAQDVAQEAFVIGYRQLAQLKDPRQFGSWLRVITQNLARRHGVRESRSRPVDDEQMDLLLATHEPGRVSNPIDALLKKERDTTVRTLVGALPDGVQVVVQLYYGEQWSVGQIAEFLGLTKTTVKWRLHTGRKRLTSQLDEMVCGESQNGSPPAEGRAVQHRATGEQINGQSQEERGQAHSPHAGRDCVACGG